MELKGEFETHLTVSGPSQGELARLRQWAKRNDLKYFHIVLERGANVSQPMLTRKTNGTFSEELKRAAAWRKNLERAGFRVTRIKIELSTVNLNPDRLAPSIKSGGYFENHVKLLLDAATDIEDLSKLAAEHTGHLSRNASKKSGGHLEERFITQRFTNEIEADEKLESLLSSIRERKFSILKIEKEFVVFDSNLALDDGWISTTCQNRER